MTKYNEDIVREVLDTLYEAKGAMLGLTALDSELEIQIKIQQNECATTRRIDRAISAIQQLEESNPWHKASEEPPKEKGMYLVWVLDYLHPITMCFGDYGWDNPTEEEITHWMKIPELPKEIVK